MAEPRIPVSKIKFVNVLILLSLIKEIKPGCLLIALCMEFTKVAFKNKRYKAKTIIDVNREKNTVCLSLKKSNKIALLPAALATLTDKQRYVVQHYFFKGEKQKVIAKRMQVSPMMVHKHLEAAKKRLQKFYANHQAK